MSTPQVSIMRVPGFSNPDGFHYKPVDLTPQKASQAPAEPIKPDLVLPPQSEEDEEDPEPANPGIAADPEKLGRDDFKFLTTLGTGTFARVWLVKPAKELRGRGNINTSQVYALKVLRKADVIKLKQCEHTENERNILWGCRKHPFICHLVDSWSDWNCVYLLMDYAAGGELFTYLRQMQKFPVNITKFYAAEIASAFIFLHSHGIIYRDLKPENVMIDTRGHVSMVDFGFSKQVGNFETYTLCGTPDYIAPEQLLSKGHGKAVDWWALGVLIFELSCGYPPFWDRNPRKTYEKILKDDIHFPSSLDLPEEYKDIVRRFCTKDLSARLGNMRKGSSDVKRHPFFRNIDWEELKKKTHPGPLAPKLENPEDTTHFEPYEPTKEREDDDYTLQMYDKYENFFRDF